jgi:HEAT repeat protein
LGDAAATSPLVGFLRDPDPVVRTIAARSLGRLGWRPANDSQRVMHILALGNLKDLAALGPEGVGPLLDQLQNGTPGKQLAAIKALTEIKDPRVRPALMATLKSNSSAVRVAALTAVARLADEAAYPEIEKLLTDDHSAVRVVAVEAAVACGGTRAVEPLIARLKDESWEVRLEAALALGELGDPAAVTGLCELVGDPDRDVREKAVEALGRIRDPRAIASLVPALVDVETAVRNAAGSALRRLDRNWAARPEVNEEISHINKALKHSDYWVRHQAGQLLEQFHLSPPQAQTATPAPADPHAADAARPHPAVPILTDLLFDRDRDLRLAAAVVLGRLADQTTGPILGAALRDEDPSVRQAAQHALDLIAN